MQKQKKKQNERKEAERKQREYEASLQPFYMRDDFTREQGLDFVKKKPLNFRFRGICQAIIDRFQIRKEELM